MSCESPAFPAGSAVVKQHFSLVVVLQAGLDADLVATIACSHGGSRWCGGSVDLSDLTELSGTSCQLLEVLQGRVGVQ